MAVTVMATTQVHWATGWRPTCALSRPHSAGTQESLSESADAAVTVQFEAAGPASN
jgi:hypothetical protein